MRTFMNRIALHAVGLPNPPAYTSTYGPVTCARGRPTCSFGLGVSLCVSSLTGTPPWIGGPTYTLSRPRAESNTSTSVLASGACVHMHA